jgi:FKBP-type peptidyl-prolyl cis-trans isomerase
MMAAARPVRRRKVQQKRRKGQLMRILITTLALAILTSTVQAQQGGQAQPPQGQPAPPALKTTKDKASYGIGLSIGGNLKRAGLDLDLAILMRGIADVLSGAKPALTPEEAQQSIAALQQEAGTRLADKNKQEGAAFLAKNKVADGVKTLPSGLQYKVIKAGDGKVSPKATDTVSTQYTGRLLDGTVFDSSRGEAVSFGVNQVIAGWTEALQLMKVGDKWQLFIPSELAYGAQGAGGAIGPNATLVFDIELVKIEPAKP